MDLENCIVYIIERLWKILCRFIFFGVCSILLWYVLIIAVYEKRATIVLAVCFVMLNGLINWENEKIEKSIS